MDIIQEGRKKSRDYKMKEPKVAIIVATYNQEKLLKECLKSLRKTNYKNYKVFFVDDTGRNIGKEIEKEFEIKLITTKGRSGQVGVWNKGISEAIKEPFDYLILIDDDMEFPDRNWLKKMVEVGKKNKDAGIIGCGLVYPDGSPQHFGGFIKNWEITKSLDERKTPFEVDHIMGCFMMIRKEVIDKVGLIDEIYNPYLLEETDYCLRTKKAGFKILSVPYVKIIHKKGKTINTQPNSQKMFVRFKNDIIFSRRHLRLKDKLFRLYIFLPLVALFRKQTDEDELKFKNFVLRRDFLINEILLLKAFFYVRFKGLK